MTMKADLDAAIRGMLQHQRELADASASPYEGLNGFTMWHFEGVHDDLDSGTMASPSEEEFDRERAADDTVLCFSLYQDLLQEAPSIPEALRLTAMAAFGTDRERDMHTFLRTLNGLEGVEVREACQAIAKGLQSTYTYAHGSGLVAVFSLTDVLLLADQKFRLLGTNAAHLSVLRTEYVIPLELDPPMPEGIDGAVAHVRATLATVGLRLLRYIFG